MTLIFAVGMTCLWGQQWPLHTQYMLNKYRDNPAYGGMERSLSVFSSYRDQYSTLNGNPRTFYLGADMPFYIWNGAAGFVISNQSAGVMNSTDLKVSYNYVMGTPIGFLSFGGRAGVNILNVNSQGITTPGGNYEGGFDHNDPNLDNNNFNGIGPTWELGAFFYNNEIEAGLTIYDIPDHGFSLGSHGKFVKSFSASLFFQYKYRLNESITLSPSTMIRADKAAFQTDVGLNAKFSNNLLAGLNFRGYGPTSVDALSLILGTNIGDKYFLTYSYDLGLGGLSSYHQGSHEVMLSYNLQKLIGLGLPPPIIYNPRDL